MYKFEINIAKIIYYNRYNNKEYYIKLTKHKKQKLDN